MDFCRLLTWLCLSPPLKRSRMSTWTLSSRTSQEFVRPSLVAPRPLLFTTLVMFPHSFLRSPYLRCLQLYEVTPTTHMVTQTADGLTNASGLTNHTLMSEEATSTIPPFVPKLLTAGQRCSSPPGIVISEKYTRHFQGTWSKHLNVFLKITLNMNIIITLWARFENTSRDRHFTFKFNFLPK